MQPEIAKALPSVMTPERFTRIVISAVSGNKDLQACTAKSFLGAMMNAAQLGVEPNTPLGQAYLIPYKTERKVPSSVNSSWATKAFWTLPIAPENINPSLHIPCMRMIFLNTN